MPENKPDAANTDAHLKQVLGLPTGILLVAGIMIGHPVIPFIIILFCIALVLNTIITETEASIIGLLLILSGIPLYVYFRRKYPNPPAN